MSCSKDKHTYIAPSVLDVVLVDTVLLQTVVTTGGSGDSDSGGDKDPFSNGNNSATGESFEYNPFAQ